MRLLAFAFVLAGSFTAMADDKQKEPVKPTGTWTRDADGLEVRATFTKDEVKFFAKSGDASATVTCKYEMDKDGLIKATITDVKVKGDFPATPKDGQEMKFKFTIDGKKAKLSDFESKDLDHAKQALEGDYEVKKSD